MKDIHHTTESKDDKCTSCKKGRLWFWHDEQEKNGFSERYYTFDEVCGECYEKEKGVEPKTLQQLNEERKYETPHNR